MELKKSHRCKVCPASFNSEYGLAYHDRNFHNIKCDLCDMIFKSKSTLGSHITLIHKSKEVKCVSCDAVFGSSSKCQYHFPKGLSIPISSNETTIQNRCNICDKQLSCPSSLLSHMKKVHGNDGKSKCYICDQVFDQKQLENHIAKSHVRYELFHCYKCDQSFGK